MIDLVRFFELASSNQLYVNRLTLHEIKSEVLEAFTGEFEKIGKIITGEMEQKTKIDLEIQQIMNHILIQ